MKKHVSLSQGRVKGAKTYISNINNNEGEKKFLKKIQ